MSLTPSIIEPVPAQTVQIARASFPKVNLYLSMRDELGMLFEDADFTGLFSRRGHPEVVHSFLSKKTWFFREFGAKG